MIFSARTISDTSLDMRGKTVLAFDPNTICTGVVVASLACDGTLGPLQTHTITPQDADGTLFGYLPNRKPTTTPKGQKINAYVKHNGEVVSKAVKKYRDLQVKEHNRMLRLSHISAEVGNLFKQHKPSLCLVEMNKSFRSMQVTKRLAEVAGVVINTCEMNGVPLFEYDVLTVRKHLSILKTLKEISDSGVNYKDPVKEAVKMRVLVLYGDKLENKEITTDESDALAVFHYWYSRSEFGGS